MTYRKWWACLLWDCLGIKEFFGCLLFYYPIFCKQEIVADWGGGQMRGRKKRKREEGKKERVGGRVGGGGMQGIPNLYVYNYVRS